MKSSAETRKLLGGISQADFAALIGVSARSVENWEQKYRSPPEVIQGLFFLIEMYPSVNTALLLEVASSREYKRFANIKCLIKLIKGLVHKKLDRALLLEALYTSNKKNFDWRKWDSVGYPYGQ